MHQKWAECIISNKYSDALQIILRNILQSSINSQI